MVLIPYKSQRAQSKRDTVWHVAIYGFIIQVETDSYTYA
jgi:hypothetical protein